MLAIRNAPPMPACPRLPLTEPSISNLASPKLKPLFVSSLLFVSLFIFLTSRLLHLPFSQLLQKITIKDLLFGLWTIEDRYEALARTFILQ